MCLWDASSFSYIHHDSKHPKLAVFFRLPKIANLGFKKAMFNLNENNRFVMSCNPIDLSKGVDSLCGSICIP